ncbi:MAG: hypothetical protein U0Y82_02595 [Thermoleophilia bacterium]
MSANPLAAALAVMAVGAPVAAAAPSGVVLTQEGTLLRVSWVAGAGDAGVDTAVHVAAGADFAFGDTCSAIAPAGTTTATLRCMKAFPDGAFVRVAPLSTSHPTDVRVPATAFDLHPRPVTPTASVEPHNRQRIGCTTTSAEWGMVDGATLFHARITVGGTEVAAADLPNPISGDRPLFAKDRVDYTLRGTDVGREVRCEVTATQGAYMATQVTAGVVLGAVPGARNLRLMLTEAAGTGWYDVRATARRPSAGDRRAGALRSAHVAARGVAVSPRDLGVTATLWRRPAGARRPLHHLCAALRRTYDAAAAAGTVRGLLDCRAVRVPGADRAIHAVAFAAARNDLGSPVIVVQSIVVMAAGDTSLVMEARVGDAMSRRAGVLRRAVAMTTRYAPRFVAAALRE